ncbi:MAG: hypothetical protein HQ566_01205 [Candidatus Omnitrophica bacterium]|nr:hypothetical protein [Candidatus Omnitrophota bacterium]
MNIQDNWEKALKNTKVVRSRVQDLQTFSDTSLPYICLSEAVVNVGDTVVRKGEIMVGKPGIILPSNLPQFEGFDFEKEFGFGQDMVTNFLLVRGVAFPSMKYDNKTQSLSIYNGHIEKAIAYYSDMLQRREDVHSGLIVGPEDCWQFCVLIFICTQVAKSADTDIRKLIDRFRNKNRPR